MATTSTKQALSTSSKTTHGTFNGTLDVTAVDARITNTQKLNKQDPYCYITLGSSGVKRFTEGESWGKEKFKTSVHNGAGQQPRWNESHTFSIKNMPLEAHLNVKIYDKDTIKDDYIGVAKIDLATLLNMDGSKVQYFPLHEKGAMGAGQKAVTAGEVGIKWMFHCTEYPTDVKQGGLGQLGQQQPIGPPVGQQSVGQSVGHQPVGQVGHGQVGQVGHGQVGQVGHGQVGQVGHGQVGHGQVGHGQVGHGQVGHGQVGHGQVGQPVEQVGQPLGRQQQPIGSSHQPISSTQPMQQPVGQVGQQPVGGRQY